MTARHAAKLQNFLFYLTPAFYLFFKIYPIFSNGHVKETNESNSEPEINNNYNGNKHNNDLVADRSNFKQNCDENGENCLSLEEIGLKVMTDDNTVDILSEEPTCPGMSDSEQAETRRKLMGFYDDDDSICNEWRNNGLLTVEKWIGFQCQWVESITRFSGKRLQKHADEWAIMFFFFAYAAAIYSAVYIASHILMLPFLACWNYSALENFQQEI